MNKLLHQIKQVLILLIAVQVMNVSIDVVEFRPLLPQVLSEVNESNSVTEFFAETILGKKATFPENRLSAEKAHHPQQKSSHITVSLPPIAMSVDDGFQQDLTLLSNFSVAVLAFVPREITPRPPRI